MADLKYFLYVNGQKRYFVDDRWGDFRLTLQPKGDNRTFVAVSYQGDGMAEIHLGVEMPIQVTDMSYTLIPAIYYNGNHSEPTKTICALTKERGFRFEAPASACSVPVAMHFDGRDRIEVLRGDPFTKAGPSGFVVTPLGVEFVAPAVEEKRYYLASWRERGRYGYRMEKGDHLSFTVHHETVAGGSVRDLFCVLNERYRTVDGYSDVSSAKIALPEAADLVTERMMKAHHIKDAAGHSLFTNISELEGNVVRLEDNPPGSWIQLSGWCGGSMTAYALLRRGGACRQAAVENLDFMTTTGLTESGLMHGFYDGRQWRSDEGDETSYYPHSWKHIRPSADFIHYLLKAVRFEESIGNHHPTWRDTARKGLDAFCSIWERYGEFGFRVLRETNPPELLERGSCAGAFVLQALAEGMRCFPDQRRYRAIFQAACEYYHRRFVLKGHCTGGPLDIERADDSEIAAALTDAYTQGWLILGDRRLLAMAEDTAQIFASWVVSYAAPFPTGTTLFGYNPCGGVIANVQNRHIGPGICTNSGQFLHELFLATGKGLYGKLYNDIRHAAVNFVALSDHEFSGYDRGSGRWIPFKKGVVSEQVNLSDVLNESGEMWNVACSWPATAVLLMAADTPD